MAIWKRGSVLFTLYTVYPESRDGRWEEEGWIVLKLKTLVYFASFESKVNLAKILMMFPLCDKTLAPLVHGKTSLNFDSNFSVLFALHFKFIRNPGKIYWQPQVFKTVKSAPPSLPPSACTLFIVRW